MSFEEKYMDVLHNIEFAIISVYRKRNELIDYDVSSAIESLIDFYIAEQRNREPRNFNLSEKSLSVYEEVKQMCGFQLGRNNPDEKDELPFQPKTVNEILDCLKKIKSSIKTWTKAGGRQGYLDFVKPFV
jgi:hypothetical protein